MRCVTISGTQRHPWIRSAQEAHHSWTSVFTFTLSIAHRVSSPSPMWDDAHDGVAAASVANRARRGAVAEVRRITPPPRGGGVSNVPAPPADGIGKP